MSDGLLLRGKQLPPVPANPSLQDLALLLSNIVDTLNSHQQSIDTKTEAIAIDGTKSEQVFTFAHNLGYVPRARAYLNNVELDLGTLGVFPNVHYPIPNQVGSFVIGAGGGGGAPSVGFDAWLDFFVDSKNIYFHVVNASAFTATYDVTYTLERDTAN